MSASLRVLHVVQTLGLGGAERMAVELANRLVGGPVRPFLLATRADGPLREELREEVPARVLDGSRWSLRGFAALRAFVEAERIDLIHSHGAAALQFVAAARLLAGLRCRHLFHEHHGRHAPDEPGPSLRTRLALRSGVTAVVGVSRATCAWLHARTGWPRERIFFLRNGIDTRRFDVPPADVRRQHGLPEEAVLVVQVANLRPEKDHLTALRALARCPSRDRIRLLLVGGTHPAHRAWEAALLAEIGRLGIERQVRLLGPQAAVAPLLRGCDAGLLSSASESGPLAILEYMAAGLPFAATRVGEIPRELPPEVGFIVPPGEPEALAAALERLVALGPEGRRAMGARGAALVRREYDQARTADRLAAIYEQVARW